MGMGREVDCDSVHTELLPVCIASRASIRRGGSHSIVELGRGVIGLAKENWKTDITHRYSHKSSIIGTDSLTFSPSFAVFAKVQISFLCLCSSDGLGIIVGFPCLYPSFDLEHAIYPIQTTHRSLLNPRHFGPLSTED